jgi:ABC-type transport system involved in multi-copper enzyme maturation permease subunit
MAELQGQTQGPQGAIYDLGYRPYEGPYCGRAYALWSLLWDDTKRALGVKKSWKYKLIVLLLLLGELGIFFFYLLTSELVERIGPGVPATLLNPYSAFYEGAALIVWLLSALVVPDLICNDRRYRVYPLYVARPIYSYDYLLAKGLAAVGILTVFLVGPALLLFLGKAFLARDALQYISGHQRDLFALLIAGPLLGLFYGSFALGISSLTSSRGYAAGAILGVLLLSGLVSGLLLFTIHERWALLVDVGDYALRLKDALFGTLEPITIFQETSVQDEIVRESAVQFEPFSPWVYGLGTLAVVTLSWAVAWVSFRREAR